MENKDYEYLDKIDRDNTGITRENEYNYRRANMTEKEKELAKKYDCDGLCYGCRFMCPRVETCPETRFKEGLASIFAAITVILGPILLIALFIWLIVSIG